MKKLINWLIHILGGYTEEEYADVCCQRNVWKNLHDMGENHLRIAENAIECWRDKYTTEHENYLALLNCHNAMAEAAQKMVTPVEMAKAIKAYCKGMDYCENCDLMGESGLCKINGVPCYWEVE